MINLPEQGDPFVEATLTLPTLTQKLLHGFGRHSTVCVRIMGTGDILGYCFCGKFRIESRSKSHGDTGPGEWMDSWASRGEPRPGTTSEDVVHVRG